MEKKHRLYLENTGILLMMPRMQNIMLRINRIKKKFKLKKVEISYLLNYIMITMI